MRSPAPHDARRADAGLTLVETLAAMALILVVASVFYLTYRTATGVLRRGAAAAPGANAGAADIMRRDLMQTVGFPTGDEPAFTANLPDAPGLRFIALAHRPEEPDPAWSLALRIAYTYDENENILIRETAPYDGPGEVRTNRLADDCRFFSVECFDGEQWLEHWNGSEQGIPRAVRMIWVAGDPPAGTNEVTAPIPAAFTATSSIIRSQMPARPGERK